MIQFRSSLRQALCLALFSVPAAFAQFTPGPNPVTTTVGAQTLTGGTGTVNSGGAIKINSGSTVPLTISGTSTLVNNGTIQTLGTGRAIDSNSSGSTNLTVTNTGLISSVSTDAFRVNTDSAVSLTNSGTIQVTAGGQAIDWAAITSKSNVLNNLFGGSITAVGEDAVRPGTNGVVNNAGTIAATPTGGSSPSGSDGIDLRTFAGISITNSGSISGRHGIATDGANTGPSTLSVTNNAGTISALNGSGINVDGVSASVTANVSNASGATIKGGVLAAATDGDGDGIDVDGVLTLTNAGDILGLGARGAGNNAEGIAAGGGSITNAAGGRIVGSTLLEDAPNGNALAQGNGILIDNSSGGSAVAATSVINNGLIQGKSGFGVRMIGSFGDTVTNNTGGVIRGTSTGGALQAGGGNDVVTNSGTIQNDSGSLAIALEAGNDTLNVTGGSASIIGGIDGGTGTNTMSIAAGQGGVFAYASQIVNFASVTIDSGKLSLSNAATINAPVIVATGGTLGGTGSLLQSVSVQSGGTIAAGNSPGTLSITGNLNLVNGSEFDFELGPTPTASDLVAVNGVLNLTGSGLIIFNVVDAGLILGAYDLITFGSSNGLTLANLAFGSTPSGFAGNFALDGNSVSLVVTAIPEPAAAGTLLGIFSLAAATAIRARSRRRNGLPSSSAQM